MSWISGSGGGYAVAPPSEVPPVAQSDTFNRTKVLSEAIPSVMDGPWNAACQDGIDDTVAVQSAMDALSTIGTNNGSPIPLMIPPGRPCLLSSMIPRSYIDIYAHGAILKRNPADTRDRPIFYLSPSLGVGSPITEFSIRGARMGGTGLETSFQGLVLIAQSDHITIEDCHIHDLPAVGIYLADSQYLWVERNHFENVTVQNPINLVNSSNGVTKPLKHIWCDRNIVTGFNAIGIALVSAGGANRTDPVMDAHVTNNTCETTGNATGGWPIAVEQGGVTAGGAPNVSGIDISGNTCIQNGTFAGSYAIVLTNDSTPASNDPLCISDVTVRGNRCRGGTAPTAHGILCTASGASITDNIIRANAEDIVLQGHGTAIINSITIAGNVGRFGTGNHVLLFGGLVDPLTLTVKSNGRRVGPVAVAVPATGVAVTGIGYDRMFYVTAGASICTMTLQDGRAIAIPASAFGTVLVPAGQTVTPTYTNAPTWVVEGD